MMTDQIGGGRRLAEAVVDSKYEVQIDLHERNSSYYHLAEMVGSNKRVLDVGCDTGYFGEALIKRGNRCSGVEYVASTADAARKRLEKVVTADLETVDLVGEFGEGTFDVVIFGDVLEHLRDPLPVLRNARRLLAPGGCVLISVPNIAHGDVRLALLDGRWDYTETGLLDKTHTRFFTRSALERFLHEAGYLLGDLRRTRVPMFQSEQNVRREDYPSVIVERIEADPDCSTYQFVLKAIPDDSGVQPEQLAIAKYELEQRVDHLDEQIQRRDAQIAALHSELHALRSEDDPCATMPPRTTRSGAGGARSALARRLPRLAALYRKTAGQ